MIKSPIKWAFSYSYVKHNTLLKILKRGHNYFVKAKTYDIIKLINKGKTYG